MSSSFLAARMTKSDSCISKSSASLSSALPAVRMWGSCRTGPQPCTGNAEELVISPSQCHVMQVSDRALLLQSSVTGGGPSEDLSRSAFVSMQGLMCCLQSSTQPGGAQKEGTCCLSVPVEHYAISGTQMGALETKTNMGDCCPMAGGASPAHCFCRKSCQGCLSQRCGQYCPLHPRRHRHPCSAEPAARHPAQDWPLHHLAGQCNKVR